MKKHKILDHPVLGGMLITFIAFMYMQLTGAVDVVLANMQLSHNLLISLSALGNIVFILIAWLVYRLFFKKEFQDLSNGEAMLKGCKLLALPTLLFAGMNVFASFSDGLGNPLVALICGAAPGISEEILFRGFFLSNAMRNCKTYKSILVVLLVSSVIFGVIHFSNMIVGAGLGSTITQVIYAFGLGMLFGAAYLRTGSLLPSMIAHGMIDIAGYLSIATQQSNGVLGQDQISWLLIGIGLVYAVLGLYFIRPSKKNEIMNVWNKKWVQVEEKEYTFKQKELQAA